MYHLQYISDFCLLGNTKPSYVRHQAGLYFWRRSVSVVFELKSACTIKCSIHRHYSLMKLPSLY